MRKSIVEEWRDIPKYCGLYQASNLGYIRSVTRVTIQSGAQRCIKGRTLSPAKDKFGYSRVHKDENPNNNEVSNLEWCTVQYNNTYGSRNLKASLTNSIIQLNNSKSKAVIQLDLDGNFISEWPSISEIKRQLGFDISNIANCCKKHQIIKGVKTTRIQAYGYKWRYK